jgi:hypothetical protein
MDDRQRAEAWKSRAQYEESLRLIMDDKVARLRLLLLDALELIGDVRDLAPVSAALAAAADGLAPLTAHAAMPNGSPAPDHGAAAIPN